RNHRPGKPSETIPVGVTIPVLPPFTVTVKYAGSSTYEGFGPDVNVSVVFGETTGSRAAASLLRALPSGVVEVIVTVLVKICGRLLRSWRDVGLNVMTPPAPGGG